MTPDKNLSDEGLRALLARTTRREECEGTDRDCEDRLY